MVFRVPTYLVPDSIWVSSPSKNRVTLLDASSLGALETIALPPGPTTGIGGVFAGDVWLTSEAKRGTVIRIEPETMEITRFRVPGVLFDDLAQGFGSVWVSVRNTGNLHRIDPGSMKAVVAAKIGGAPAGVVAARGALWVTDYDDGSLRKVDPGSGKVLKQVELGATLGPPEIRVRLLVGRGSRPERRLQDRSGEDLMRVVPTSALAAGVFQ